MGDEASPETTVKAADHTNLTRWVKVRAVSSAGVEKRLHLENGERVTLQRFACAGVGDFITRDGNGGVWVKTLSGDVPVSPPFKKTVQIELVAGRTVTLNVSEVVTAAELDAHKALAQFHYRNDVGFGRRSILLMTSRDPSLPQDVGFIEVTTPFLHLKNRSQLFDAPFCEPGSNVSWSRWDLETRNRLINVVARISRFVVHPEVRGLGLTRPLLDGALDYCRTRWSVKGIRPLFLEITAEMLDFMPFVEGAGMRFIGLSQGNFDRLLKDMAYLDRAGEARQITGATANGRTTHSVLSGTGKGILRLQKRDITTLHQLRDSIDPGADTEVFLRGLLGDKADLAPENWEKLLPLLRFPKPTYMKGLTPHAESFVQRRVNELAVRRRLPEKMDEQLPASGPLRIKAADLAFNVDTGALGKSDGGVVRRAFGLDRTFRFQTGLRELNLTVEPGQVCYVYGASGSGKTCLLNLINNPKAFEAAGRFSGNIILPGDAEIGTLNEEFPDAPLISALGAASLDEAIFALNSAGLSEPRLYLSRFWMLSAGQRYRAHLARLACSATNVWLLDEFASGLDDATAMAVGRTFARAARRKGVICVLAAVRRSPLVNAVEPDTVVHLNQIGRPAVLTNWREWGS